jgi:dipeptidase
MSALNSMLLLLWALSIQGCTDILVTPGASADGTAMIAYNADSPLLFGSLYHYPPTSGLGGTDRPVYDWDSGVYQGVISEVNRTFNVVGNSNEFGLVIGESTFGGVPMLAWNQSGAILDYGSLIYITLQRARTARQAIHVMSNLLDTYGYSSGGESFSIADHFTGDVWYMEVISRGNTYGKKGAVWVAQRLPDGAVSAHANHARITQFPRNDPKNCLYADDVVDVAIHYGLYPADADPLEFSFSDAYDPLVCSVSLFAVSVELCDSRIGKHWLLTSSFLELCQRPTG